jgi:hypothetical protein
LDGTRALRSVTEQVAEQVAQWLPMPLKR